MLARLLRMDEIVPVSVPTVTQEAARDLVRAREDCRADLMRARHRVTHLLLRNGIVYYDGKQWTGRHDRWLRQITLPQRPTQLAFTAGYETMLTTLALRDRLDAEIGSMAADSEYTALVRRLACLRGIATLTAFGLAVEIGDWHRFTGRSIGSFVGLVPTEHTSDDVRRQGPVTKAGNSHARRLLVEAAWHHRKPYRIGKTMQARWAQATPTAAARGDKGNRRLAHRWARFDARSKKPVVANAAIARELAAWCWSLAVIDD